MLHCICVRLPSSRWHAHEHSSVACGTQRRFCSSDVPVHARMHARTHARAFIRAHAFVSVRMCLRARTHARMYYAHVCTHALTGACSRALFRTFTHVFTAHIYAGMRAHMPAFAHIIVYVLMHPIYPFARLRPPACSPARTGACTRAHSTHACKFNGEVLFNVEA